MCQREKVNRSRQLRWLNHIRNKKTHRTLVVTMVNVMLITAVTLLQRFDLIVGSCDGWADASFNHFVLPGDIS
jgi:hypothetical protein